MSDPRKGLASASAMARLALCPGSLRLVRDAGLPDMPGPYAEAGTRIASYLEAVRAKRIALPLLPPAELEVAQECQRRAEGLIEQARAKFPAAFKKGMTWLTETRLWGGTPRGHCFSGRFDWAGVNVTESTAIVVDDKSGWGDLPDADVNLQLRTLAVLAAIEWGVKNVVVALNPAHGKPTTAFYDEPALTDALLQIWGIVDTAEEPNATRRMSKDACKFCPVKCVCDKTMENLLKVTTGKLAGDWPTVLDQLELADLVIKDLRAQAKAALAQDPNAIPGWYMAPGDVRTSITDSKAAYGKLSDLMTSDEWMAICTTPIGKATELFAAKVGLKKKVARAQLEARLDGLLEKNQNAPSLERVKQKENKTE